MTPFLSPNCGEKGDACIMDRPCHRASPFDVPSIASACPIIILSPVQGSICLSCVEELLLFLLACQPSDAVLQIEQLKVQLNRQMEHY